MKRKSKRSNACEFSAAERSAIAHRDYECIFCKMHYMPAKDGTDKYNLSIMHYIPRSKGGLGIRQNGAVGCAYHHDMLDNGNKGNRQEMLNMFAAYLKSKYVGWNEENLIYRKECAS